jgi:hypothetical protein
MFIGIPSYNGLIHNATVKGLLNAALVAGKYGWPYAVEVIPHDAFIGKARDLIAHKFLASGFQDLVFVDADIGFDIKGFLALCKADVDVAMGLYRMKEKTVKVEFSRFPALIRNPIELNEQNDNLVRLEYGPAGFMKIRRSVFEKMIEKWPEDWFQDDRHGKIYDFFPCGRFGHDFIGEDISFCNRLRELDIPIWGVQGVDLDHYGEGVWGANWRITHPKEQVSQAA